MNKEQQINEMATVLNTKHYFTMPYATEVATILYEAGYHKQNDTVKEFAEQLKKELFAKCVVIQTISNPQKEDMDSSEAFQIINELAEQYGKEE